MADPTRASHDDGPCPDGDACPDARRYGSIHPRPGAERGCILDSTATGSDYLLWWRANGAGYTYDVQQAGRYTREEYERAVDAGNRFKHVLVPEREVEANTTRVVHYRVMREGLKVLV